MNYELSQRWRQGGGHRASRLILIIISFLDPTRSLVDTKGGATGIQERCGPPKPRRRPVTKIRPGPVYARSQTEGAADLQVRASFRPRIVHPWLFRQRIG